MFTVRTLNVDYGKGNETRDFPGNPRGDLDERGPLSVARHYGGCTFDGHKYLIVDKLGRDVFECSEIAEREGREMAIEPGEPVDLVREDFVPVYRRLGRERVMESLGSGMSEDDIRKIKV